MHYYQFNIADYRKDTAHLTPLEHYIYRQLMDSYYLDEKPIPKETRSVIRRLGLGLDGLEMVNNVLSDFFFLVDDEWHHKRIDAEIDAYHGKVQKNKENGKKGGRPKKQPLSGENKPKKTQSVNLANPSESESKPNQEPLTNNHKPLTINQEPITKEQGSKNMPSKLADSSQILDYLNQQTGKAFKHVATNIDLINARLKEGHAVQEIMGVIDRKCREWPHGHNMHQYLRPETLFGARKFNGYVGELGIETPEEKNTRELNEWANGSQPVDNDAFEGEFTHD